LETGTSSAPHALLADDDPSCLAMLTDAFHHWGLLTSCYSSGSEAWAAIEGRPRLSVAVVNWMLPDLDGHWIARWMRELKSSTLVAVMIGRTCLPEAMTRMDLRADYILTKPFPPEGIDGQVQRIVQLARRRQGGTGKLLSLSGRGPAFRRG
jgi:DNA-binding response OmpR family regulator